MLCDDDVFISQDNSMTIIIKYRMPGRDFLSSSCINFIRIKMCLNISDMRSQKFRFNYLKFPHPQQ